MTLKQYVPLSIGVFVLTVAAVHYVSYPVMPFALILLFGETILGLQLEDHRVPRFMASVLAKPRHAPRVESKHPESGS